MNTNRLSFKAVFLLNLLSAACASVPPNADREEGQAAVTSKTSDADIKEARSAFDYKDYTKAIRLLTPLAEQGNPKAQYALGTMYAEGSGVSKDYSEAMKWFRKSAEQGYPKGQAVLGWMYDSGSGVDKDYSEAAKWYRKAAEQGDPYAQTALGTMHGQGQGVSRDYSEAMKWYRKAADQGYPDAQWRVGSMYVKGQRVPKDYAEAEKWFRKAASLGHPQGQFWLGHLYFTGLGVNKDLGEAAKWFKLAATNDEFREAVLAMNIADMKGINQEEQSSLRFLKSLIVPPEALALSYLAVSYNLKFAEIARSGTTFHTAIDGKWETIDKFNAETYVALFKERLNAYSNAIRLRGFQQIAKEYDTDLSQGCDKLGFSQEKTIIEQDEFRVQVVHGPFQGELGHRGVIVESALAIEHAMNPETHLIGQIQQGHIELNHEPSECIVTLTIK